MSFPHQQSITNSLCFTRVENIKHVLIDNEIEDNKFFRDISRALNYWLSAFKAFCSFSLSLSFVFSPHQNKLINFTPTKILSFFVLHRLSGFPNFITLSSRLSIPFLLLLLLRTSRT